MRLTPRRLLIGVGVVLATSVLSLLAPTHAVADDCYTVSVANQGATICPWS